VTPEVISVAGGAGSQETAAILAAVVGLLQEEAAAAATPPPPPRQSRWVLAWRPRAVALDRSAQLHSIAATKETGPLGTP
jgi:hypothetical protein